MTRSLLLLGLLPSLLVANAIRQAEPAPAKRGPEAAVKTAQQRWANALKADAASFRRHVIPLMARAGCSGRECHGSFSGRGGFQLSLFGYDFEKDHTEITADADGGEGEIRVNLKNPEQSLVLLKPTMQVKHKGKERIKKDSWEYNLLLK